jgi:hypothetical protein
LTKLNIHRCFSSKSNHPVKRCQCRIVQIQAEQHQFHIQDNIETVEKIKQLVTTESLTVETLSTADIERLSANTLLMSVFDAEPYRAIIKSHADNDQVNVCLVDFGRTRLCSKNSLKRCSESLSAYPYQAKLCDLHGVPVNKLDRAFEYLNEKSTSASISSVTLGQADERFHVLIYIDDICVNQQYGYDSTHTNNTDMNDQSNVPLHESVHVQEDSTTIAQEQQMDTNPLSPKDTHDEGESSILDDVKAEPEGIVLSLTNTL